MEKAILSFLLVLSLLFFSAQTGYSQACENFDTLTVGAGVAEQLSENWILWTNDTVEDALITDSLSYSQSNSFLVEGYTDLVGLFSHENLTSGVWHYSNYMYIPNACCTHFNLQKDVVPGEEWGFQAYFDADGSAYCDAGGSSSATWTFYFDVWNYNELIVDLDNDYAEYWFNGELIVSWAWSLGLWGNYGAMTLGGANYYAFEGMGEPMAYFDDVCFEEYSDPDCDYFDDYIADDFLCTQSDLWTTWDDNPGGPYDAYVTDEWAETTPNAISIDDDVLESDIVYDLGQKTSGKWVIELDIMVRPGGYGGYYNVMQDMELFGAANEWGFEIYFESDGTGYYFHGNSLDKTHFSYQLGVWNHSVLYVDLDEDLAMYEINDEYISLWQWSAPGPLMLGAVNIYAHAHGTDDPKFYVDNFCFEVADIHIGIEVPVLPEDVLVHIYPNPSTNQITIKTENTINEVRIYNNVGRIVYSNKINDDQISVNTSSFNPGIYVVEITVDGTKVRQKLLVQ